MTFDRESLFKHGLIEANRALIALAAIDERDRDSSISGTLQVSLLVYTDLLAMTQMNGFSSAQEEQIQAVLDRLKAYLKYFGEEV